MSLPVPYTLRPATPADAPTIAVQRERMFSDMGHDPDPDPAAQRALSAAWLARAIPAGEYLGWVVEAQGALVAGVGVMFQPRMPTVADQSAQRAYVMNMYVAPDHRRRGLAEALMRAVLDACRQRGLPNLTLHAAPMGRALYERLGFRPHSSPELRLVLEP